MLFRSKNAAAFNKRNTTIQFWQQPSHSIELLSEAVTQQKLDYIHLNPVRARIVRLDERLFDFPWSKLPTLCGPEGKTGLV